MINLGGFGVRSMVNVGDIAVRNCFNTSSELLYFVNIDGAQSIRVLYSVLTNRLGGYPLKVKIRVRVPYGVPASCG